MHPLTSHWYAGWSLILAGFVVGSILGLFFHQPEFMGGYGSFPRRLVRLGHIACIALGMVNLLFAGSANLTSAPNLLTVASVSLLVGSVAMPAMCFLTAWRPAFRHGFAVPVLALVLAVALVLIGGLP
jgi:hypothetical protein